MFLSRLGPLPYFGRESEGGASDDGLASVRALVEAQLALEPHSQRGYRLGLIDPPDAGAYLSMLADLADEGKLSGAHLTIYRHPRSKVGVELRLDEAEEDRIARVFRAITPHRLFTFEIRDLPRQELAPPEDDLHHLVVAFDQSTGQMNPARAALHPIQPLAIPRRIAYREIHKTVELEPASGGPFEDYDKLVRRLARGRDLLPRRPSADEAARGAPRDRQSRPLDGGRRPPGRPRPAHRRDADHDRA